MSEKKEKKAPARKRSLTEVTLGWIADRVRRAENIKCQVEQGTYQIDSKKIASAILNEGD